MVIEAVFPLGWFWETNDVTIIYSYLIRICFKTISFSSDMTDTQSRITHMLLNKG